MQNKDLQQLEDAFETETNTNKSDNFIKDIEKVINYEYAGIIGKCDPRFLFTVDDTHRFRVNWWREEKISFSVFIKVKREKEGFKILKEGNL